MIKIAIFYFLLFTFYLSAATYWVDTNNGDDGNAGTSRNAAWATIGQAVSSVAAGDIVYVLRGLYQENITMATGGSASQRIQFIAYEDSVIIRAAGGSNYTLTFNDKSYITIKGFYFQGDDSNSGIIYNNADFIYILNCYFIMPDNSRSFNFLMDMLGAKNTQFKYNVFYGDPHGASGLIRMLGTMDANIFSYNTFNINRASVTAARVNIFYMDSPTVTNTTITNNIFYCHDSDITTSDAYCFYADVNDTSAYNTGNNAFDYNIVYGFSINYYTSFPEGDNVITSNPLMVFGNYALTNYIGKSQNSNFKLWGYVRKGSPAINASSDGYDIGGEPYVSIIGY